MEKSLGKLYLEKFKEIDIENIFVNMDNDTINQILLEIYKQRSEKVIPNKVLEKYITNDDYFGPGSVSLRKTLLYNLKFMNVLPEKYETLELSMINPLGTNSSITLLSQNMMLSTIKNSEVCGDPTTSLTLEACKRRKQILNSNCDINTDVNLSTITKVLRMQKFDKTKGYMQHFNLFGLVSSGRKQSNIRFDIEKIKEHIKIWLDLCLDLEKCNFKLGQIEVGITNISFVEHMVRNNFIERSVINVNSFNDYDLFAEEHILLPSKIKSYNDFTDKQIEDYKLFYLKKQIDEITNDLIADLSVKYPDVNFHIEMDRKGGLGYYNGLCFHVYSNISGQIVPLCDGGVTDWNVKLLSDRKELSVTSGFGAELVLKLFGVDANL